MCAVAVNTKPNVEDWFAGPSKGFEGGTNDGIKGQNTWLSLTWEMC